MSNLYRLHYRAQLKEEYTEKSLQQAIARCQNNIRTLQREGRILTAALYYADKMLFLYYEAVGEPLAIVEPAAITPTIQNAWKCETAFTQESVEQGTVCTDTKDAMYVESGEDIQVNMPRPNDFLAPLAPFLMTWPGQRKERLWVHMYHIYYHSKPESAEGWKRVAVPEQRRGRIAFLRDDKLFSYIYHHKAIVDEGLLVGDRYQSIALHENILFSYFEEPKTMVNVQNNLHEKSKVIEDWIAVNPESHFIHMPEGGGENFMFLPALFAMGVEDL